MKNSFFKIYIITSGKWAFWYKKFVTKIFCDKFATKMSLKYSDKNICLWKPHKCWCHQTVIKHLSDKQISKAPNWCLFFVLKIDDTKILLPKYWCRSFYKTSLNILVTNKFVIELTPFFDIKNWRYQNFTNEYQCLIFKKYITESSQNISMTN